MPTTMRPTILAMSIAAAVLAAAPDGDSGPTSQLGRHIEKALADRATKDAATPAATRPAADTRPAEETWCFGVTSDAHLDFSGPGFNEKRIRERLAEWVKLKVDFGVIAGDLGGGTRLGTPERFAKLLASVPGRPPLAVAFGNHECDGPGKKAWLDTLYPGVVKGVAGNGNDRYFYYSFDHRGCHFVFLNVNRIAGRAWYADRLPAGELAWLDKDLAAAKGKPTFIFCHEPFPLLRNTDEVLAVLGKHPDVAYVFHGHLHTPAKVRFGGQNVIAIGLLEDLAVRVTGKRVELCTVADGKLQPVATPLPKLEDALKTFAP